MELLNNILINAPQFDMFKHSIVLCYRGSIAHNTYVPNTNPNSIDDKDIIGVAIPSKTYFYGLKKFEQFERKEDYWDVLIYDFKKFINLLIKSNPNVLSVLWTPSKYIIKTSKEFEELVEYKHLFVHKGMYSAFFNYAKAQLYKMEHMAYAGYMGKKRKSLVDKFGYDVKNASHLIRLLRQGIEFLNTGELIVERPDKEQLIAIKTGQWSIQQVKEEAEKLFAELTNAYNKSRLPEEVNLERIDKLTQRILEKHFN